MSLPITVIFSDECKTAKVAMQEIINTHSNMKKTNIQEKRKTTPHCAITILPGTHRAGTPE